MFITHRKIQRGRSIRIIRMRYILPAAFFGARLSACPPHLSIPFRKGWVSRLARCSLPHPCRRSTYRRIPVPPRCSVAWATDGIVIWQTHRRPGLRRRQNRDCTSAQIHDRLDADSPSQLSNRRHANGLVERHVYIFFFFFFITIYTRRVPTEFISRAM